jgi:transcriptional regulator NrdR family protein
MRDQPGHEPNHPGAAVGLRCWKCAYSRLRVIYTRAARGGKVVRRRECLSCGARITTWERQIGT